MELDCQNVIKCVQEKQTNKKIQQQQYVLLNDKETISDEDKYSC